MPLSSRSLFLQYGGDFQLNARGGLLTAVDTQMTATSTLQRLQRLLLTNPQIVTSSGAVVARGDCLWNQSFGVGLSSLVDETATSNLFAGIKAKILSQIAQYPDILQDPPPVITITNTGYNSYSLVLTVTTNSGQVITTPANPIAVLGG